MEDLLEKKYKIEDLKVGMKVKKQQLSDIFDTWIILTKPKNAPKDEISKIRYIGKDLSEIDASVYDSDNVITPIYNDSIELQSDICF